MAGAALSSPFQGFLWNQYLVQSDAAKMLGVAEYIPTWIAPQEGSAALVERTFFHRDWLIPILFLVGSQIIQRIDQFGLGYSLFRITSDVEKLPFPMAPVAGIGGFERKGQARLGDSETVVRPVVNPHIGSSRHMALHACFS